MQNLSNIIFNNKKYNYFRNRKNKQIKKSLKFYIKLDKYPIIFSNKQYNYYINKRNKKIKKDLDLYIIFNQVLIFYIT